MPLYLRGGIGPLRYSHRLTGPQKRRKARPVEDNSLGAMIFMTVFVGGLMGWLSVAMLEQSTDAGITCLLATLVVIAVQWIKWAAKNAKS